MMKRIRTLLVCMFAITALTGLLKAEGMANVTEKNVISKYKQSISERTNRLREDIKKSLKEKNKNSKKKKKLLKKKKRLLKKKKKLLKRKKRSSKKKSIRKKRKKKKKNTKRHKRTKSSHKKKGKKRSSRYKKKRNKRVKHEPSFEDHYTAMMADFDNNVAILMRSGVRGSIFSDPAVAPIYLRELQFIHRFCKYAVANAGNLYKAKFEECLKQVESIKDINSFISILKQVSVKPPYTYDVFFSQILTWKGVFAAHGAPAHADCLGKSGEQLLAALLIRSQANL